MLLAAPFGLAIGLSLGLVGAGGSILAVPILVYVLGEDARAATTASLVIVAVVAAVATLDHARSGDVRWRTAVIFAIAAAPGTVLGTVLNRAASGEGILIIFALVMLAAAYPMATGARATGPDGEAPRRGCPRVITAGVVVGALAGFLGVGGGFLIVPVLVLAVGLRMPEAVGTSLAAIALIAAVALPSHLASGSDVDWATAAVFAASGAVGAVVGSRLTDRMSGPELRHAFATILVLVAAFLLVENAIQLA